MSNEKKNPLIGAFRAPPVGTPPSITQPTKQPETPKDVKVPAASPIAPVSTKSEESKKPAEPAKDDKTVKDSKPAAAAPVPTKPEEGKICSLPAFRHRHFQLFIWVCSRLEPRKRLDPAESIVGADTGHCRGIDRQHRPAQRVVTASTGKTSTETEECPWEKKSA